MVQIGRSYSPDPDMAPMRFKVYVSPKDRESVLGYVEPYGVIRGSICTRLQTPFGVPVAEAYARAVELAESAGVPVLFIDDPEGVFPASLTSA